MSASFTIGHQQRGIGLIEVLVSLLLLAIGVIGFAALQVRSVGATNTSFYRTQAMTLAQDFTERMRANYTEMDRYRGVTPKVAYKDCLANSCTTAELVTYDIQSTAAQAAAALPNGQFAISQCKASNLMCVYVSWNDTTTANDGSTGACGAATGSYASSSADCMIMEVFR